MRSAFRRPPLPWLLPRRPFRAALPRITSVPSPRRGSRARSTHPHAWSSPPRGALSRPTRPVRGAAPGEITLEPLRQALLLAGAAIDKKAVEPVLLQVGQLSSYADYLLVLTASSVTHAQAIHEHCARVAREHGLPLRSVEGLERGRWVLADFGNVVVHTFQENDRLYYDLEGLWTEAPRVDLAVAEAAPLLAAAAT